MSVTGKVVLITGAASGIGKGIAHKLAANGARVVIADRDGASARSTADELAGHYGYETLAVTMDVTDEQAVHNGVETVVSHFGAIDVLISNAGIQIISSLVDFDTTQWKRLFDIHVHGTFLVTRACMRHMIQRGCGGRIIVMGSVHSLVASKNKAAYVSAKHAQHGFVRAVAEEGGEHGIGANLICPGFVKTPLVEKQIPEQAQTLGISEEEVVSRVMLGQTVDGTFTTIEDIAEMALFVAGFNSNALSGEHFIVSHGWGV